MHAFPAHPQLNVGVVLSDVSPEFTMLAEEKIETILYFTDS